MGKQRVLGVSHAPTPGTRLPKALSSFLGTAYLFPQRLAENEQIRHGNIYDRGCILSHAPIPCKGRGVTTLPKNFGTPNLPTLFDL